MFVSKDSSRAPIAIDALVYNAHLTSRRGSVLWRFQRDFEWSFSAYKTCTSILFCWYLWKHRYHCANFRTPARGFREYVAHSHIHPRWLGATCWFWNYKCKVVVATWIPPRHWSAVVSTYHEPYTDNSIPSVIVNIIKVRQDREHIRSHEF